MSRQPATSVLTLLCLALMVAAAGAGTPIVTVQFDKAGLSSLTWQGTEYLAEPTPEAATTGRTTGPGENEVVQLDRKPTSVAHDPDRMASTWTYPWGVLEVSWQQSPMRLHGEFTLRSTAEGPIWDLRADLLRLQLPARPTNDWRWRNGRPLQASAPDDLHALIAQTGDATLAWVRTSDEPSFGVGFSKPHGKDGPAASSYTAQLMIPGELEPGDEMAGRFELRFADGQQGVRDMAMDVIEAFRERYPVRLDWPDRRPIGRVFMSSSYHGHKSETNPRGWFNDPKIDVTTEQGRADFHKRVMDRADRVIEVSKKRNGQGVIVWDIEGQEYPHATSFIGDPRVLGELAPEMDAVADEFFKRIRGAGVRVGICIRPSHITISETEKTDKGKPVVRHVHGGYDPLEELDAKIKLAKQRWGATIFYIDTNVWWTPGRDGKWRPDRLRSKILHQLYQRHPDILIVPEFQRLGYWGVMAGYMELRSHAFGNYASTPHRVLQVYPEAFGVISINEGKIEERWDELVASVKRGDILFYDAWWDPKVNQTVQEIYQDAGRWPTNEQ